MNDHREAGDGMSATHATGWLRAHSSRIMTVGVILALLFLARSVLIPLALAIVLSLLVAPLVRALRRLRIGKASSVLVAVAALTVLCVGVMAALGTQILHIAESLPQYESNVQRKLKILEEATVGPIIRLTNETSRLTGIRQPREAVSVPARDVERSPPGAAPGRVAVNRAFGLAIWMSLSALRLPQALLCGILAGVMRFVPYVGVATAALFAAALALAVDPGWSLALSGLGVFILLDIVVGQLVEPHLYGHATGLSPLSVVGGGIFWSWLWGPPGLTLSTT